MIRLHHADRLEPLLDALADVLRAPVDDPFAPELIVVPSMGMADTVLAGLGRRLGESSPGRGDGVAANLEFAYPGRFVGRALGDESTGDVAGDPWSIDRLTWSVLDVLADDQRRDVPTLGVPVDLDQGGLWVLARHVADLFDRYITQRPQMITLWADGVDSDAVPHEDRSLLPLSDEHRWQAAVWRAVRARIGVSSPAEMMPYLLTAIRAGEVRPSLPPRVALFGFGSLAPGILAVLRALDGHRELHAFVRHPSSTAWTGLDSRLAGALQIRGARDLVSHTQHPLISSWGRPSLEARALLNGIPEIDDRAVVTTPAPRANTLLTAVQDGIRADRAPTAIVGLDGTDGSLQVHACHGELRQLEVLRDALGHRFASDPTLQPHEVHVLCPDLERFAPLVQAVFDRGALPIPVRVGDRSLTVDDPFAGALQALLGLVAGRASLSDVLAVMQYEPVRRRFHWSLDHVERIAAWAVETGTRWGLEPHHRTEWGVPGTIDAGTWRLAVDRLLLGIAMPAPSPRQALGDLSPFDDLGGDDIGLVGTLADFLERLLLLHDRAEQARPIADWVDVLHATADDFLAADRREPWRLTALHRSLDAIVESASAAASGTVCAVPLSFGDLRAVVERTSSDRPGRLSLRTGAVTVTSLVPLHGVPARVVCLLGLDDGSLRSGSFDGDDILGGHPCVGERHPRHESRQMLLDAVLAPSDSLIITCNGADLTTNKPTPFVVPLVELIDATSPLVGSAGADGHDRLPFVVRHPRHGFDERALVPGGLTPLAPGPFTFDTAMLDGAVARRDAVARRAGAAAPTGPRSWALPARAATVFALGDVVDTLANPSKTFVRGRLDVRLPSESAPLSDDLDLAVDSLTESGLGRELLELWRAEAAPAADGRVALSATRIDEWRRGVATSGSVPPGAMHEPVLQSVVGQVADIVSMAGKCAVPLRATEVVDVDVDVAFDTGVGPDVGAVDEGSTSRVSVTGVVAGVIRSGGEGVLVDVGFTKPRDTLQLQTAVRLAALQLVDPSTEWSAITVRRPRGGANPIAWRMRLVGGEATAHRLLSMAVQVHEWAMRDAVPLLAHTSKVLGDGATTVSTDVWGTDCRDASVGRVFAGDGLDAFLAAPVVPSDPAPVGAIAAERGVGRAVACASWVWASLRRSVLVVESWRDRAPKSFDEYLADQAAKARTAARKAAKQSAATTDADEEHE